MGAAGVERVPDDYAPSVDQAMADAVRYLAEERPFHAHEVLEGRWKTGPAEERELWQGLAQICVGLTHVQRGNAKGAATLLARGAAGVARYGSRGGPGAVRPFDLDAVVRVARELATDPSPDPTTGIARVRDALGTA